MNYTPQPIDTTQITLPASLRDLMERLGATLSRMRIASVTLVHPSGALGPLFESGSVRHETIDTVEFDVEHRPA